MDGFTLSEEWIGVGRKKVMVESGRRGGRGHYGWYVK